jgi:HK97 family phage major capsid protein
MGGPITDPGWTGENELIPERDASFDEITLLPETIKSVKVLTRFSNELARQSIISLAGALQDRLVTDVADKLDAQFMSAGGDGITTPKGIFAYSGTQNLAVGGALTLDVLLDAYALAMSADVNTSALRWFVTPREFIALRKVKDGQQRYQLQPDPTQDSVFRLFGVPVTVTKRLPDTTATPATGRALLADMSQVTVARDLAPTVTVLRERFAEYDQQALRVVCRYDAAPVNPEAIVKLSGITV